MRVVVETEMGEEGMGAGMDSGTKMVKRGMVVEGVEGGDQDGHA